ncbi:hypothetical protein ACHAPA_012379 [Fusarium lateritium]
MFHTRKATERHDKIYALLGMSSDDTSLAGLSVDYQISWGELFRKLINFISERVHAETWDDNEIAVIRGKGYVLGEVASVQRDADWEDRWQIGIAWKNTSRYGEQESRWAFKASAKSIQVGDAICLLQGASMPSIIRLQNDYWTIVMIAAHLSEEFQATRRSVRGETLRSMTSFPHDLLLVWNWDTNSDHLQVLEGCGHLMGDRVPKCSKVELDCFLEKLTRLWNTGLILVDMRRYEGKDNLRRAMNILESVLSMDGLSSTFKDHNKGRNENYGQKQGEMVDLLTKDKGKWISLLLAAENGNEAVVKLLLNTSRVETDTKDKEGRTPLWWAASNGQEGVVKLLLSTKKVELNAKDGYLRTPILS